MSGSAAIHTRWFNVKSLALGVATMMVERISAISFSFGARCGWVFTVREPEVSWRHAVATARRTVGSLSEASLRRTARSLGIPSWRSPMKRAAQARMTGSLSAAALGSWSSFK